jgi:hypothetical protein
MLYGPSTVRRMLYGEVAVYFRDSRSLALRWFLYPQGFPKPVLWYIVNIGQYVV